MLVRFHMSPSVISVEPKQSLGDAQKLLESHGVRQLPVVHDGLLVGIITDRDLRSDATGASRVEELMTRDPITIESSESVDEAARLLRRSKVNALPVVDGDQLVGMLSTSDVLDAFVMLSGVAEPTYRIVIEAPEGSEADAQLREILGQHRAEVGDPNRPEHRGGVTDFSPGNQELDHHHSRVIHGDVSRGLGVEQSGEGEEESEGERGSMRHLLKCTTATQLGSGEVRLGSCRNRCINAAMCRSNDRNAPQMSY